MLRIEQGSVGPEVTDIQRRLVELGHSSDPDDPGIFAVGTKRAVRTFQQARGLIADGVVGDDTWRALVEASLRLGDRTLYTRRPMLRGDDVRELQERLNLLGFDAGTVDGIFGPDTDRAVRDFQDNYGLDQDGIAGGASIDALRRLHRQHQSKPAFTVREREMLRSTRRESVAGARIMIDPGHGPDDPGPTSPTGVAEHQITWEIANRVEGRLLPRGIAVVMARGPRNTPPVGQRAKLANAENVTAVLGIHLNSLQSRLGHGAAAYYFGQGEIISEAGRRFAEQALDKVCAATGAVDCRAHPATSGMLRQTRAPAIVVEPGFVTHPDEGQRLCDPGYQDLIAGALAESVVAFLLGDS